MGSAAHQLGAYGGVYHGQGFAYAHEVEEGEQKKLVKTREKNYQREAAAAKAKTNFFHHRGLPCPR
jgi:hypothetical protein